MFVANFNIKIIIYFYIQLNQYELNVTNKQIRICMKYYFYNCINTGSMDKKQSSFKKIPGNSINH